MPMYRPLPYEEGPVEPVPEPGIVCKLLGSVVETVWTVGQYSVFFWGHLFRLVVEEISDCGSNKGRSQSVKRDFPWKSDDLS